jgi:general secretion pathway protein J
MRLDAASREASEDGFTLLEIMIALVVFAALMAGLAQGVQFGVRAWNNQIGNVARNADLDTADRTLRVLLTRMQPPAAPDRPSMEGGAAAMQFVSELPAGAPVTWTRLASITLLLKDHRLLLRWAEQPHAKLLGPPPQAHDEVLLDGVGKLALSYRARSGSWSTTWTAATLPQLIRIHLEFGAGSVRRWPDILVAPMRDSISETGE